MSKQEFFEGLRKGLSGLAKEDIEERISFYNEMIDDRMEEGLTEEEAVAEMGSIDMIVEQILSETPISKIVKEKVKPDRGLDMWELVLIVIGSPIWLSLLIAGASIMLAFYLVVWSLVITLWSIELAFVCCFIGGILGAAVLVVQGNGLIGAALFGAGLCFAGLSIYLFYGCYAAKNGVVYLTKKIALRIKKMIIGKERE